MCRCTPSLRTPWCGKLGCEAPAQQTPVGARIVDLPQDQMAKLNALLVESRDSGLKLPIAALNIPNAPELRDRIARIIADNMDRVAGKPGDYGHRQDDDWAVIVERWQKEPHLYRETQRVFDTADEILVLIAGR